jgi:hypothetical protein
MKTAARDCVAQRMRSGERFPGYGGRRELL